ncbi:formin-like protein 3 [Sphaerodactylus townsendi]|uniref:formin-like protein 3 n=1 Tax=Sphaerodactylus townsendi TaxID=933632 RepID=UPI0020273A58|nr:formin-like protein 3 [Sphaerodactylus townsendi]
MQPTALHFSSTVRPRRQQSESPPPREESPERRLVQSRRRLRRGAVTAEIGRQLLEHCAAEAENQRLAQEAEREWRQYISDQLRLDHEAFLLTAARTQELMAERTEVLRRMTDLRLQQQGDRGCGHCQAALHPPSPELLSSSQLPQPVAPPPPVRGRCTQRRGPAGPTSSPVATHSQLMEASHSHLLEAACPPSPELLECSELLEPPTPPPLVRGKRGQRRGPAGPTSASVLTHSQLKELARPPSPELVTCSKPLELAAPAPPIRGKRGQKRGAAGRASSTLVTHSQMEEDAQPPTPDLFTCSQPLELPAPTPPLRGRGAQQRGSTKKPSCTLVTHTQLQETARPPSPELHTCSLFLDPATPPPPMRSRRAQRGEAAGPAPSLLPTHSQLQEPAQALSPVLVTGSQLLKAATAPPPVRHRRSQSHEVVGAATQAAPGHRETKGGDGPAPHPTIEPGAPHHSQEVGNVLTKAGCRGSQGKRAG